MTTGSADIRDSRIWGSIRSESALLYIKLLPYSITFPQYAGIMTEPEESAEVLTSAKVGEASEVDREDMGNCTRAQREEYKKYRGGPDYSLEKEVVHNTFLKSGKIAKALIITYPDRRVQVTEPRDFQPPPKTLKHILNAIEGKTTPLATEGIDLGEGKTYTPGKFEVGVSIYGTHPDGGGCIIYKTPMSLIIAVYTPGQNPSMANRLVVETADIMAEEEEERKARTADGGGASKLSKQETEDATSAGTQTKSSCEQKDNTKDDPKNKQNSEDDVYEYEKTIVKDTLIKSGKLSKALIFGYKDKTIHANEPPDFQPPVQTFKYIVQALEGNTVALAEKGIDLGEANVFVPGKIDEGESLIGICPNGGGCVIYKTSLYVLIGIYGANQNPSMANRIVLETSDMIKDEGR